MRRIQTTEKMARKKNYEVNKAELPYDTPPDDMEEGVCEKKHDKNENIIDRKEVECQDETPNNDMEEGVDEKIYEMKEKYLTEKRQNDNMTLLLLIWRNM